jgi:predicted nucleotidyltransferase component of viral defense system
MEYPTFFKNSPAPKIRAYPTEAVVAEKLHALVKLGELNSRLKDFYDLYVIAKEFTFEGSRLSRAISATFERRRTDITLELPIALTSRFFEDEARATQWRSHLSRNSLRFAPSDFGIVSETLRDFLVPIWEALSRNDPFKGRWSPTEKWQQKRPIEEFP